MVYNLIFYAYINVNNIHDYIINHLFLLEKYSKIFNGEVIITIGTDSELTQENISILKSLFNFFENADIEVITNDSNNRESICFLNQLGKLNQISAMGSYTFYAHTKGSTYEFNEYVQKWFTSMYYFNLSNLDKLKSNFQSGKLFSGIFRLDNPCPPWVEVSHHYSGTFFWINTDLLFSKDWLNFNTNRFGVESYPGNFDLDLCALSEDLFNTYVKSLLPPGYDRYDLRYNTYWTLFPNIISKSKLDEFNSIIESMNVLVLKKIINVNPSAWTGHFAIKLVKTLKPLVTVELGVDWGYSIFAFAFPKYGKVWGIDWFQGDEHAGIRNAEFEVRRLCNEVSTRLGLDNIEIIKGDFNEVALKWDKSIDILHIDGLHTFDAVQNDFQTWSKFLKKESCVLFHDIDCFEDVNTFFESLDGYKLRRSGSCGLGIWTKDWEVFQKILKIENG